MCGITGFWSADRSKGAEALRRQATAMAETIQHRGPDGSGAWADETVGIALGHRRLAILDLSPAGHQPMLSPDNNLVLSFNGEIYNHLNIRQELEARDPSIHWKGHSDTETLLHAFSAWGVTAALQKTTGMFALALWNVRDQTLTLARDRFGEKPLYYGHVGKTLTFGSELKPLRLLPGFTGDIDQDSVALYLRFNYVPAPRSIYRGIRKLLPGTTVTFRSPEDPGTHATYWSLETAIQSGQEAPFQGDIQEAQAEVERRLSNAVKNQLVADVPVGALLSGGVDSTLVCSLAQTHLSSPLQTFTVGFPGTVHDEAPYAREIATKLGTQHHELTINESQLLDFIPQLPTIYDEPFADSSQIPTCAVMKFAREHVTVALSGDGADETFGGYNRYVYAPLLWSRMAKLPTAARSALGSAMARIPPSLVDRLFGRFASTVGVGLPGIKLHKLGVRLKECRSENDLYISVATEWQRANGLTKAGSNATSTAETPGPRMSALPFTQRMMALDTLTYLPDDVLTKVDRASMNASLETRAPFLDHSLVEFAWTLPQSMKVAGRQGKAILRRTVAADSRQLKSERPKKGFSVPLDDWLRGPLRDWAESNLQHERKAGSLDLDHRIVSDAWRGLIKGKDSLSYRIWSILCLTNWLQN